MIFINKKKHYNNWIKTSEQLPPLNKDVLLWKDKLSYSPEIGRYTGEMLTRYWKNGKEYTEVKPRWFYQNMSAIGSEHPLCWTELPMPPYDIIKKKGKRK